MQQVNDSRARRWSYVALIATAIATSAHGLENPISWLANAETESDYNAREQIISLRTTYAGGERLSLATSYVEHFADPLALPDGTQRDVAFWGAQAAADFGDILGTVSTEVGYGGIASETGTGFGDTEHRYTRIDTKANAGNMQYGTHFQSAGSGFYRPGSDILTDRTSAEAWVSRTWDKIRLRTYINQGYNNLDRDPARARLTDTRIGTRFDYTWTTAPTLITSFDYAAGNRRSSLDPTDGDVVAAATRAMRAGLNYKSDLWTTSAFASYSTQRDVAGLADDSMRVYAKQLSGSMRVTRSISLQPGVSSSVTETPTAPNLAVHRSWVSLRYQPRGKRMQLSSYVSRSLQDDGVNVSEESRRGVELNARWRIVGSDIQVRARYDQSLAAPSGTRNDDVTLWLGWHAQLAGFSPTKYTTRFD